MFQSPSTAHQKVQSKYIDLFSKKSVSNKKNDARGIIELIVKFYLNKYSGISSEELKRKEREGFDRLKQVNDLIKKKIIPEKHRPALYFIQKEGNLGSHEDQFDIDDAGEASYAYVVTICLKPIIKRFFNDEGLSSEFLNEYKSPQNKFLNERVQSLSLHNQSLEISCQKLGKKNKYVIVFIALLGIITISSFIYIINLRNDLNASQIDVQQSVEASNQLKKKARENQFTIDSLKTIVNSLSQKLEVVNGIKNEFNGNVENVTNTEKIESLKL